MFYNIKSLNVSKKYKKYLKCHAKEWLTDLLND